MSDFDRHAANAMQSEIPARDVPAATHGAGQAPGSPSSSQAGPDADLVMLREAVEAQPRMGRASRLHAILTDVLTAEELRVLGNNLGLSGHMKARSET
jgi:hypothetical protein